MHVKTDTMLKINWVLNIVAKPVKYPKVIW